LGVTWCGKRSGSLNEPRLGLCGKCTERAQRPPWVAADGGGDGGGGPTHK